MIKKPELVNYISKGYTIYDIMCKVGCSKVTVRNKLKKFSIITPKGFYRDSTKKLGRPKGIPMPSHQKKLLHELFSGNGNPFYGKNHTDSTKQKMVKNHVNFSGNNNPFKKACIRNPTLVTQSSKRKKDWWASRTKEELEHIKTKFSKAQTEHFNIYGYGSKGRGHFQGWWFSRKCHHGWFLRSSYELNFTTILDNSDYVVYYVGEPICVPYKLNNCIRYTKPDVLITLNSGKQLLIEIKPIKLISTEINQAKFLGLESYADENSIQFIMLTNLVFNQMDIIFDRANNGEYLYDARKFIR